MLDTIKAFGTGGRLYADNREKAAQETQPKPATKTTPKPAAKKTGPKIAWRDHTSTAAELAGVAAVAYGCYQIYAPAGWLAGGISLVVLGVAAGADR